MIRVEYYYLKASELLLFFFKLKTGEYGHLYGVVDPMVIMSALIEVQSITEKGNWRNTTGKNRKDNEKKDTRSKTRTPYHFRIIWSF